MNYLEAGLPTPSVMVADHDLITMLADISVEHDNLEYINKYAPQAEELANRHDHRLYQAVSHRALGAAHRLNKEYKQAENRLSNAQEIFEDMNTDWQLGRTYYEFGQLSAAQDRSDEAKKHFEQAVAHFENMGALPDIKRTQSAIESLIS